MTHLELMFYPPRTAKNEDFNLLFTSFAGMRFAVVNIPAADREKAETLASVLAMRFTAGVPTVIGKPEGVQQFPFNYPNVMTLENAEDHPVYQPDYDYSKAAMEEGVESEEMHRAYQLRYRQ